MLIVGSMKRISLGLVLLLSTVSMISAQFTVIEPEAIAANVLIGQVYPSGNTYLRFFDNAKPAWPRSVLFAPISSQASLSRTNRVEATLSRMTIPPDYIPGVEGLDDDHRACGTTGPRKKNPEYQYQSDDFFDAAFDYCDPNDGVALYRSSGSSQSSKVLAFTPEIALTDIRMVTGPRLVTAAEKKEITKQKEEMKRTGPCTTTPAFIDSAVRLMEAAAGDRLTVRLSSYKTPGCSGHLATIYVLDVLRGKDLIRTFQISQSHGPL